MPFTFCEADKGASGTTRNQAVLSREKINGVIEESLQNLWGWMKKMYTIFRRSKPGTYIKVMPFALSYPLMIKNV